MNSAWVLDKMALHFLQMMQHMCSFMPLHQHNFSLFLFANQQMPRLDSVAPTIGEKVRPFSRPEVQRWKSSWADAGTSRRRRAQRVRQRRRLWVGAAGAVSPYWANQELINRATGWRRSSRLLGLDGSKDFETLANFLRLLRPLHHHRRAVLSTLLGPVRCQRRARPQPRPQTAGGASQWWPGVGRGNSCDQWPSVGAVCDYCFHFTLATGDRRRSKESHSSVFFPLRRTCSLSIRQINEWINQPINIYWIQIIAHVCYL